MTAVASTRAAEQPAVDRVCHCDKPQIRTQATGKWSIRSECATCGGLAPLTLSRR